MSREFCAILQMVDRLERKDCVLQELIRTTDVDPALSYVAFHCCGEAKLTVVDLEDSFFLCHCSYGEVARFHKMCVHKWKCDHGRLFVYQERWFSDITIQYIQISSRSTLLEVEAAVFYFLATGHVCHLVVELD